MTLSIKALTRNRRPFVPQRRCATSGTEYDEDGQPIGQKGAFGMWRRHPTAVMSPGRQLHNTSSSGSASKQHRGTHPRLELACARGCWPQSNASPNCYLNGDTTEYFKETCPNSRTMTRCGLQQPRLGDGGRLLNLPGTPYPGVSLDRSAAASILQPAPAVKSGLTLRGPGAVYSSQQMMQLQGIDYARGGRCCEPGREVSLLAAAKVYLTQLTQAVASPALAYADGRLYLVVGNTLYSNPLYERPAKLVNTVISSDLQTGMDAFDGNPPAALAPTWPTVAALSANPYGRTGATQPTRFALLENPVSTQPNSDHSVILSVNNGTIVEFNGNTGVFKSPLTRVQGFGAFVSDIEGLACGASGDVYMRLRDQAIVGGVDDAYELVPAAATPGTGVFTATSINAFTINQRIGAALSATDTTAGDILWFVGGGNVAGNPTSTICRWSTPDFIDNGTAPALNVARGYCQVVWQASKNRLLAIGGFDAAGNALDSWEALTLATDPAAPFTGTWVVQTPSLCQARGLCGAAATPFGVAVAGGATTLNLGTGEPSGLLDSVEMLDPLLGGACPAAAAAATADCPRPIPPPHRLGGMPAQTLVYRQQVAAERNQCSDRRACGNIPCRTNTHPRAITQFRC